MIPQQTDWIENARRAHQTAQERLARHVEQRRSSFECQQYRRRREAALKHTRAAA